MPGMDTNVLAGHKRKRESAKLERSKYIKPKSSRKSTSTTETDEETILHLEAQITESRKHYNNIVSLLQRARTAQDNVAILAAVALCRVFCRLLSAGDMVKSKGMSEGEVVIVQWLKERYKEYMDLLLETVQSNVGARQSTAMTLVMRLIKQESGSQKGYDWNQGPFYKMIGFVLQNDLLREEFAEKYLKQYHDVRFYTLQSIATLTSRGEKKEDSPDIINNSLVLLLSLEQVPELKDDLDNFHGEQPVQSKSPLYSLVAHKKQAQDAWLAVLRQKLNKEQRKTILGAFTSQIAPWFQHVEVLMDFLTDSYDVGGATSLLALSGLYYLISEKNLDYPSFFPKLYSLLDQGLLHSKHRSRFFRLLDTFMSSTHLPAALVASFIKRLARLALHGPPAGIVVVIPWIYNLFKRHPTCTFMIHYEVRDLELKKKLEDEGMDDPFDMDEDDPMETNAIDSSLWELETLQSHYHPNVATLAKIISEQFTKRSYNLDDFLDHSYNALLDVELGRDLKKEPVVEYEIPKRIFTASDNEMGPLGLLMGKVFTSR